MRKPKALFVLDASSHDRIYGAEERAAIASLVDLHAPPQTKAGVAANPSVLTETEIIFSGWGAPVMDAAFLAAAPRLKAVFYGAGSVKGFVTDAFWARDIVLTSSWGANAVPVAEMTEAHVILALKRVWTLVFESRARQAWVKPPAVPGAFGSTVGLVSLGMIGRMVAKRLQQHDVKVCAYDPFVTQTQADAAGLGVRMVTLPELFAQSDVVSLHTPNLPSTRGLITGALFEAMKPGATFINTARGAVIDEPAMVAVLERRPDLFAILDVTHPEPPVAGSPLYTLPNVVLTPHIAGSMSDECRRMGQYAVAECRRWLTGEPLLWQVTREKAEFLA